MLIAAAIATVFGVGMFGDGTSTQPPGQLQALVRSSGYQGNIQRLFAALTADVFQRCPTLISAGSTVTVLAPVRFAPDGYPVAGLETELSRPGMRQRHDHQYFLRGQPDEKITSIVALPGDTHADPTLQRDALRYAWLAAKAVAPNCVTPHVRHTRYDGLVATADKAWHESWIVAACGQNVEVPITFIPDPTGTRITTQMARRCADPPYSGSWIGAPGPFFRTDLIALRAPALLA